jgi:hypothetical protein
MWGSEEKADAVSDENIDRGGLLVDGPGGQNGARSESKVVLRLRGLCESRPSAQGP